MGNFIRQFSNKSSATQSTRDDSSSVCTESETNSQAFKKASGAFTKPRIISDETEKKHIRATTGFGKNFSKFVKDSPSKIKPPKVDIIMENQKPSANEKVPKSADFKHEFDAFMGKKRRRNNKKKNVEHEAYELK